MSIRIIKQGLSDTIQDNGRYGYQHLGINPGGAMDTVAASIANILVGNNFNDAVLEFHSPAPEIYFEKTCLIAISGADFGAAINDEIIPLHTAIILTEGTVLTFKQYHTGARVYLAVQGGWISDNWLNSVSTNTKVQAGGFHGRSLKKNDTVLFPDQKFYSNDLPAKSYIVTSVQIDVSLFYSTPGTVRCTQGRQYAWLDDPEKTFFLSESFIISRQSDRMGYRLTGTSLMQATQNQLLSAAVTKGAVQLLPDGQLIILMADHQTTGGYPVIVNVISADISILAQMQPVNIIKFSFVSIEEAQLLYMQQQENLLQLQDACNLRLSQFFS